MADEGKVCVCPQCGKKYKLKEGFEAKSFSCKGCGATVWVAGKPPAPAPAAAKAGAAPAVARKGGRGGRAAASRSGGGGRHGRSREGHEEETEGRHGRHAREKPKSKATLWLAVAGVAVVGIVIVIAVSSGKGKGEGTPVADQPGVTKPAGPGLAATGTPATEPPATNPAAGNPTAPPGEQNPANLKPSEPTKEAGEEPETPTSTEGGETPKKPAKGLGGADSKKEDGATKYDPPATLGHLETTTPEVRKQIDELIGIMFDPQAGRDSLDAKAKLAAIGKPAFLPILGKMAAIRDLLKYDESIDDRLMQSSLTLADNCLREMDGYLDAKEKQPIRPGTDKKYVTYILRLHYRRWNDGIGSTPLKDLDTMPGAFDLSTAPQSDDEEEPPAKGKGK